MNRSQHPRPQQASARPRWPVQKNIGRPSHLSTPRTLLHLIRAPSFQLCQRAVTSVPRRRPKGCSVGGGPIALKRLPSPANSSGADGGGKGGEGSVREYRTDLEYLEDCFKHLIATLKWVAHAVF